MREYFEEIELKNLSPLAVKSKESKGRQFVEPPSLSRTCFQRDRDRIVHSKAFRRLRHKTQVFITTMSDHYRSRLIHTLEVSQISRHIARVLRLNEDLTESIALAHDLGHPPFGHAGERALNACMEGYGGFEHNLQSLRVVEKLEKKYPMFDGLNLSYELLEGLKKHAFHHRAFVSLESQVTNVADEIAYNNHDIDDGLTSGLLQEPNLAETVILWREAKEAVRSRYANLSDSDMKYLINSHIISSQIDDLIQATRLNCQTMGVQNLDDLQQTDRPVATFSLEMRAKNLQMRKYLSTTLYQHPDVVSMNQKGQQLISDLFDRFIQDKSLLPEKYQQRILSGDCSLHRAVTDYIAGMTDTYVIEQHQKLVAQA